MQSGAPDSKFIGNAGAGRPSAQIARAFPTRPEQSRTAEINVATLQLYAIWVVLSIGAAGALLAWWIM
jgi:hypothetical protein